jgi:hypothetical protein
MQEDTELYFRQLLAGRQVAGDHVVVSQMASFMYLIGDARKREALVVDPGHRDGSTPTSTIGDELAQNFYLRARSLDDWRRLMGVSATP